MGAQSLQAPDVEPAFVLVVILEAQQSCLGSAEPTVIYEPKQSPVSRMVSDGAEDSFDFLFSEEVR